MRIALLAVLATISLLAFASDDNCEGITEGSTYWQGCMLNKQIDVMNKKMDATYNKILAEYQKQNLNSERLQFIDAQREWRKNLIAQCEEEQKLSGGANSISFIQCRADETKSRLHKLQALEKKLR
jgi:uncharacterized protein YecT (DUF1311 family)